MRIIFFVMVSIFFTTYGHTGTMDVAMNAQELRDQFIKRLKESSLTPAYIAHPI